MTLADPIATPPRRIGIIVDLPSTDGRWHKEIQRAEGDGSGSPVGGTETILTVVRAEVVRWTDVGQFEPLDTAKTYVYRYRIVRVGASDGTWSDWGDEKEPADLAGQRSPRLDARGMFRGDPDNAGSSGDVIAELLRRLRGDGHLAEGARIDLGGVLFNLTRGRQDGSAPDGDGGTNNATVTFPTAYPSTPKVTVFGSGGLGYHATLGSSATQYRVMKPDTLDNQGFEMVGVLQDRSSISVQTDTFPAGTLTTQGDALSLAGQTEGQNGGSGLTSDAVDDSYSTEYNATISLTDGGSSGTFTNSTLQVTVAVDKWDSDDAVWQETDSIGYFLSASEGGTDSINKNDIIEFTDSGVVSGDDVRVRIKDVTESCGSSGCSSSVSVDPVETTYNVATVTEESMSPNAEKLSWAARQETS